MNSPCYDEVKKKDCPRRCGGCAVNCPDWERYVADREKVYKQRKHETDINNSLFDSYSRVTKYKFRKRRK